MSGAICDRTLLRSHIVISEKSNVLKIVQIQRRGLGPIDLDVPSGSCASVRGASGAGKTLLLRAIAELDVVAGACFLGDVARNAMPAPQWRRQVAYVPAEPGWWADTAEEHFHDAPRAAAIAARLGIAAEVLVRPIEILSTGERLRLALVRALENEPAALLLDEPTSALDAQSLDLVEAELRRLLDAGMMIVLVSHDVDFARRLSQDAYTLHDGLLSRETQSEGAP